MSSAGPTPHSGRDTVFSSTPSEQATARDESSVTSQPSSGARALTDGHNYSIDRFQAQHPIGDDATPHGRMLGLPPRPHPDALVALYEARAARVIASFDTAFGSGSVRSAGSGSGASGPPACDGLASSEDG
ncbi:hypothetical protein VTH82DRAFT_8368 [Thermothelomyces myriococcoides]